VSACHFVACLAEAGCLAGDRASAIGWDQAWWVFQLILQIRPTWGMTACRMPLSNTYATTRSDLTS
jgi:hypothetical protein